MKIKSNATCVIRCIVPSITLLPGLNFVKDCDAASFLSQPSIAARIESGILEILEEKGEFVISKLVAKDVAGIMDVKLLEKIKAQSTKPPIVKAAEAQLAMLREGRTEKKATEAVAE
jgi:hypothetical protein